MKHELSQNERVRRKLARDGEITRNQCLRQIPAITRLAARIDDLERDGYSFKEEKRGNDYVYTLISINGVPLTKEGQMTRADHLKIASDAVAAFEKLPA